MTTKAMVVLSGGQDSTTCLFHAKTKFDEVHAVTFDYGQRHKIEIEAAKKIASMARVASHEIVSMGNILASVSPLTDRAAPLETYESAEAMEKIIGDRIEKTFVPMRNALFLVLAANRAVARGITTLVTGVCQQDNANYPDCRESFIRSMEETICEALGTEGFMILAPLMELTKPESVKLALTLPGCMEALAWSHTAYDGKYPPTSKDHASLLRAQGFEQAGVPDPLVIRAYLDGLMPLPRTANYHDLWIKEGVLT